MKKILFILLLFSLPSISYGNIFTQTTSRDIKLEYITYEVASTDYTLEAFTSNTAQDLTQLGGQYGAISGLNGVFFCPADYSACGGQDYTINERFIDGEDHSFYSDTGERAVFGWDSSGLPFLHQTNKINADNRGSIYEGLGNFPILYSNGVNILEHYHDVGLYDAKMSANLPRHFICSDKEKTEIFFGRSSSTSLDGLAPALYDIGCWDGLNLDAGASSHFNYNGKEIVVGQRKVIDGFFIVPTGFDATALSSNIAAAMPKIRQVFKSYSRSVALSKITAVRAYIKGIRTDIYSSYSQDVYDKNGDISGYTLEVTGNKDLQKVYVFNLIDRELSELYSEIASGD